MTEKERVDRLVRLCHWMVKDLYMLAARGGAGRLDHGELMRAMSELLATLPDATV